MWIYNPETELYHYGVKGMKWGVRRKRDPAKVARKQEAKRAKKTNKALYKEAKGDIKAWSRAEGQRNKDLSRKADDNINRKRESNKGYDQAYGKAKKSYNRNIRANQVGALAMLTLSVAMQTHPEAVVAGASVVSSALGKAGSTTGMYAKYAAKAAVPVSRTVKNRGYIQAILVNSGNAVGFPG